MIFAFGHMYGMLSQGEKECPYYMRTGSCKYGTNCRFNHPDPTDAAGETSAGFGNGGPVPFQGAAQSTIPSWSAPRSPLNEPAPAPAPAPFVPMMIPPNQGVPSQSAEWNGYQVLSLLFCYAVRYILHLLSLSLFSEMLGFEKLS